MADELLLLEYRQRYLWEVIRWIGFKFKKSLMEETTMPSIAYPTPLDISAKEQEGYILQAYENVGIADMEPCTPGKYNNPELMMIEEDTKTAILYYL